jgi:hypothetical protein
MAKPAHTSTDLMMEIVKGWLGDICFKFDAGGEIVTESPWVRRLGRWRLR